MKFLEMTMMHDPIIIEISTYSLYGIISVSIVFIGIGFWLFRKSGGQTKYNPAIIKGISLCIIVFFLICSLYGLFRITDRSTGLIIDKAGIRDNSSEAGAFISWKNIKRIELLNINDIKSIGIFVDNPDEVIGSGSDMRGLLMKANYRLYGTPVLISCVALKCNTDELFSLLRDRFLKSQ